MENSTKEDYKIQSFDLETQKLLKTALKGQLFSLHRKLMFYISPFYVAVCNWANSQNKSLSSDPSAVDLDKVSNVIVDQSLKDQLFSKEAGRICYTIVQVSSTSVYNESMSITRIITWQLMHTTWHSSWPCSLLPSQAEAKQNNGSAFRRNLLNRLQQEFKAREETRLRSLQEWVCYVTFICNVFDYLKVRESCTAWVLCVLRQLYDLIMFTLNTMTFLCSKFSGQQHAHGGSGAPCVWLFAQTGSTRCPEQRRGSKFPHKYSGSLTLSTDELLSKGIDVDNKRQRFSLELRKCFNTSIRKRSRPDSRWTVWCCSCTASGISWRRWTTSGWTSCFSCCGMASCSWRGSAPWAGCFCWRSSSSGLAAGRSVTRPRSTTTVKSPTDLGTCADVGEEAWGQCVLGR